MTLEQKRSLYLKYRQQGLCHIDAIRKVLADERLPSLIRALSNI